MNIRKGILLLGLCLFIYEMYKESISVFLTQNTKSLRLVLIVAVTVLLLSIPGRWYHPDILRACVLQYQNRHSVARCGLCHRILDPGQTGTCRQCAVAMR